MQTLGAFALALMAVGYVAGRYRESVGRPDARERSRCWARGFTLLGVLAFAAIQVGTGIDADVSALVVRDAVLKTLLGAALALPLFLLVRLVLRPALIEDRPGGRRPRGRRAPRTLGARYDVSATERRGDHPRGARASRPGSTILTGIAMAIFSVVFLRLWYLQVLSGDDYRDLANDNRVREVRVQAPRGDILDRDGKVLVANRTELALQVRPEDLPKPGPERKAGDAGPGHRHRHDPRRDRGRRSRRSARRRRPAR